MRWLSVIIDVLAIVVGLCLIGYSIWYNDANDTYELLPLSFVGGWMAGTGLGGLTWKATR